MKKEYIQPRLKVVKVKAHQMLCGSQTFGINRDGVNDEETESKYGSDYDRGAW